MIVATDDLDVGCPRTWRVEFVVPPADLDLMHALLEQVWADCPELIGDERMRFETALAELAGNVFEHAAARREITGCITIERTASTLEAHICDSGDTPDVRLGEQEMPDALAESGRGLALIHALVDEFRYERAGDRNVWRIARHL